ncbi:MAG TPA: DUF3857 domain-containing protein [Candidatus Dormibacteraeota bacterium]|nr:DUF3857 domain-containing protein [Candidatus Dormibacteraeota bacterium]
MERAARHAVQLALLTLLISLVRTSPAFATVGWLPVDPADLAMKDNPKEPGADAMILYREAVVDTRKANTDGDSVEEYVRIKIFTQAGVQQGHINIPYDKDWESVPYIAGRTILPDGTIKNFDGQVLDSAVVKSGGYTLYAKTFTLPDVVPGCIIEYRYDSEAKPHYVHVEQWVLSSSLYTREAHFTYFPYEGYGGLGLQPLYRTYLLPASAKMKQQIDGSYILTVSDVPAVIDEPLMPPKSVIEPRVEFYYQSPGDADPNWSKEKYWNHFAKKWDSEIEHFISKKDALDGELSKIAGPNDSPETKLRKIYARVEQIRDLSMEDYKSKTETKAEQLKPDNNVADVFNNGYATGHQINLTFIGLARAAGFDATEVYLAARNSATFFPDRKDVGELNADVVWVKAGSQEYYLDPSARYYAFGQLPWYETEASGVKVDGRNATIVEVPAPVSTNAEILRHADLTVSSDGTIAGNVQIEFSGIEGAMVREAQRKQDQTGRTNALEQAIKTWLPTGTDFRITKITNWDDLEQPLQVQGTIKLSSYSSTAARNMLMPLDPFEATQAGDFTEQTRHNAIYFHYPYEEIDSVTLHAPVGYTVEALPKSQDINLGAATYEISASSQGNTVEVKRHLAIKGVLFAKDAYPTFRAFFGAVRTDDNAQMVFQNSQTGQLN